jgi:hypothetical protein
MQIISNRIKADQRNKETTDYSLSSQPLKRAIFNFRKN